MLGHYVRTMGYWPKNPLDIKYADILCKQKNSQADRGGLISTARHLYNRWPSA